MPMQATYATRTPRCFAKDYVLFQVWGPGRTSQVDAFGSPTEAKTAMHDLASFAGPVGHVVLRRSTGAIQARANLDRVGL